jgi:superfamily I DNA/RNA helicase
VIAGAGSGKTNTLAHRVAHLIVNGADPRRILLMTFSRRAVTEMTRRVERIVNGGAAWRFRYPSRGCDLNPSPCHGF